jgi:hypothetical protein
MVCFEALVKFKGGAFTDGLDTICDIWHLVSPEMGTCGTAL